MYIQGVLIEISIKGEGSEPKGKAFPCETFMGTPYPLGSLHENQKA